ncbi:MAG: Tim44 domain-containing protein [Acidobacteriota bacterium]
MKTLKNSLMALAVMLAGVGMVTAPLDAEAKRLGGGRASGMQRQVPTRQPSAAPDAAPNQPSQFNKTAQPSNAAAPAPATAPTAQPAKRSWMGPIAGLAAGLGIAALMSHFGMGEAMGNFLMMALLAVAALFAIRWIMGRLKGGRAAQGPQWAGAGAPYVPQPANQPTPLASQPLQRSAVDGASAAVGAVGQPGSVPLGFDAEGFERVVKMLFIRLQAANDAGNVEDLRRFTTPELFASLRLDLQERGAAANQTDVKELAAQLVDTAREGDQWVASVRFHGLIQEDAKLGAQPFDELWHLVKPANDAGDWAIAGITPLAA